MKKSTITKYTKILQDVKKSGQKLYAFCTQHGLNYNSIVATISMLKRQNDEETEEVRNLISLYNEVVSKKKEILVEGSRN